MLPLKAVKYDSVAECIDVIEIRWDTSEIHALHVMDYRNNGATPTIATYHKTLYVVFRTCYRILEKETQTRIGFRAIVDKEGTYILAAFVKALANCSCIHRLSANTC